MNPSRTSRSSAACSIVVAAVIAISGCAGPSTQAGAGGSASPAASPTATAPSPTPSPTPAAVAAEPARGVMGEPVTADLGRGNVAEVTVLSASYSDTLPGSISKPFLGGFLSVDVRWVMVEGATTLNAMTFGVTDATGTQGIASLVGSKLPAGQLAAGGEAQGTIVFDAGAGPYTVIVKGGTSPAALIDVTL